MNENQVQDMFEYGVVVASRVVNAATPFSVEESTELGGYAMLYYAVTGKELSASEVVKRIDGCLCIDDLKNEILRTTRVMIMMAVIPGSLTGYYDGRVREKMIAFRFDMGADHEETKQRLWEELKDVVYTEGRK